MFAYIKGIVQHTEPLSGVVHRLVLDCHGFGIEMQTSQQTLSLIPELGQEAQIYTVFVIKETEALLFGFATLEEKELFSLLTSVSGIGPKLALAVLGSFTPQQLSDAIIEENDRVITSAPGVGAKVAQRIILELKTKIETWRHKNFIAAGQTATSNKSNSKSEEEASKVLASLGYSAAEIYNAFTAIKKQSKDLDIEGLVRESLRLLGTGSLTP